MIRIGRLHVITDTSLQQRFSHLELCGAALAGGADAVQYRRKGADTRVQLEEASMLLALCRSKGRRLIVNDRVDIGWAVGASGVHLGERDMPLGLARRLLGPTSILGGSADNAEEAVALAREGADYVGIGPVYPTGSKTDTGALLGLEGLARAVRACERPLIAIGGITPDNLPDVLSTGVYGVAVLSAVCRAADPAQVVAAMYARISEFRTAP